MADEKTASVAESTEIDVDALPAEDFEKLKRGEDIAPPKKEAKEKPPAKAAGPDETDDDGEEPEEKSQTVPHAKFHRANERAKAESKRAADAEARANLAMQRMTELLQAQQPQRESEPEVDLGPDPDVDPIGWAKWRRAKDAEELQQRAQWDRQTAQQREQERAWNEAVTSATEQFQAARTENPQIEDAYNSLRQSIGSELQAVGWRGPQLVQKLQEMEAQYILYAHQNRIPITDLIVSLAQARVGWKPKQEEELPDTQERDAAGRFKAAAEQLEKREATKKAAKSLGGSGSAAETGAPTPDDIVNMTAEEFEAFKKKFGGADRSLATALERLQ